MLRIERSLSAEPSLHGYLLGLSPQLGLMHCFDDFDPDGYTIFRLEDVLAYERGPHEKHWDRMLTGEGLLGGMHLPIEINLGNLQAALGSLQTHFSDVIIECEDDSDEEGSFYLGRMLDVSSETISLLYVDALGHWDDMPSTITLDRITKVQFDTPYLRRFMRYVEAFPSH
ncbi:MAG: hypothetical protein IPM54_29650 [Polyangiaceae bacterium]|nr:hypothetical protein [Polyangiaceae bacterium]